MSLNQVRERREEVYAIARKHKAEKLWVFGSCARREEHPESDIDLMFQSSEKLSILDELALQEALSQLLGASVDLVSCRALQTSPCFAYNVRKDMVEL